MHKAKLNTILFSLESSSFHYPLGRKSQAWLRNLIINVGQKSRKQFWVGEESLDGAIAL